MLTADQLGKKGEAHFSEICSDAELTCNPSTYDRTGWDFIVEFPYGPADHQSTLDKRHSPTSCHVQVKTMWDGNDEFRMRLSSAERLAKEAKPAFVYVFKVNKKLEFVAAHLIHMLDENLATILRRLRKEHAKGAKAIDEINKKQIAFRASKSGKSLRPTGGALRKAIVAQCGPDPQAYMEKKREQLKNLGFEAPRFEARTTILIGNSQQVADVFLGIEKAALTKFQTFETRFGIKLPESSPYFGKGTIHIHPNRADQCTITIREGALLPPAVFQGDIFIPPIRNLPKEQVKFIIKSTLFEFVIEPKRFTFNPNEEAMKFASLKIEEWISFLRMFIALCKQTGTITIEPTRLPAVSFPFTFKLGNNHDPAGFIYLLEAFERALGLLKLAGAIEPLVQFADIVGRAGNIIALSKLFSRTPDISPLRFDTELPGDVPVHDKIGALFVSFISIASTTLVYYAVTELVPDRQADKICWQSHTIDPREIVVLHNFPAGYQAFVDRAKANTNIDNVMMAQPPIA